MMKIAHAKAAMTAQGNKNGYVHGLMLLTILLIASSFPVAATITHALPPAVMMFVRFLLAALLFSPFVLVRNGISLPSLRSSINYIVISIPLVVFFWCMFKSLRYTSLLNTGALFTMVPTITAVLAIIINKDTITRIRALGIFIGTLGAVWIVFRGDWQALMNLDLNYGDFVFMIGCLFLGLYNALIKRLYRNEPMELMTFWVLCWGSLWFLVLCWQDMASIDWVGVELNVYAGIAYLSLFTTLTTFFLLQFSIVRIGATKVSAYNFLTPVFVILLGIILGMEQFIPITLPGILLVVSAMLLIQWEKDSKPAQRKQSV
ncbi:membrane protein [Desulfosarcina alkanivorans]|uniref:Membrane protein n=1 Tax=Desulfosarcina alkanivorans TaxID=571177 RepID=A0A5K7YRW0_9BACT|nr:DMT family transporter [Desulfosarcina alkanivorans]BBO71428.1 membrane protein [Desulfosarcina alkanivorans]